MHKYKKKQGNDIYKLDLEKPYEIMDWDFICGTFHYFGFSYELIFFIMRTIFVTPVFSL